MVLEDLETLLNYLDIPVVTGSPTKAKPSPKQEVKEEFERFFREVDGIGPLAKQVRTV